MPIEQCQGIAKVEVSIGSTRRDFNRAAIGLNRLGQTSQGLQRNTLADQRFRVVRIKRKGLIKDLDRFLMTVLATQRQPLADQGLGGRWLGGGQAFK